MKLPVVDTVDGRGMFSELIWSIVVYYHDCILAMTWMQDGG